MEPKMEVAKRLADDLVAHYGEDAETAAADRARAMKNIGNAEAAGVWAAVTEILARMRGRGRLDG